ncbi:A2ML1 protein, partial [Eurystomus gularis]|nr:A2ML1 protein [Eurystomus gularis]
QTGRNGCFFNEVPVASFNLTSLRSKNRLYADVLLLEEGTGMSRAAARTCMVVFETATITFERVDKYYKPGIPCTGTMLLKGTNGSALKEKEFLLVVNIAEEVQRKTLLTDSLGRASFELDTSAWSDKVSLHGELKDDPPASEHEGKKHPGYQSVVHNLFPFALGGKNFLKIRRVEKQLPCGQPQQLEVDYFFDEEAIGIKLRNLAMAFLVLAKGNIVTILKKELPAEAGLRGSFLLELPIGPELAPKAKVMGYTVLPDGKMVADSTELNVAKCFRNKVNLSFSEQRAMVGSQLRLKVQADPGSLCAVYAVDQRTKLSSSKLKLNPSMMAFKVPFPPKQFYDSISLLCHVSGYKFENCHQRSAGLCVKNPFPQIPFIPRRQVERVSNNLCAGCRRTGGDILPLSGSRFKPCPFAGADPKVIERAGAMQDTGMQMDFLGPWLWELVPVGEGGSTEVAVTVPDAITEWEAGMFCTSPLGLGLAPATTLTAFKPFFVELALPYAVVRHETFTLVATVFNYLQQCLRVRVMLVESAELELLAGTDRTYRGCVCSDKERTFQWNVRATSLGEVMVTIIATTLRSEELCGTERPVMPAYGQVDKETKLLKVQVSRVRPW